MIEELSVRKLTTWHFLGQCYKTFTAITNSVEWEAGMGEISERRQLNEKIQYGVVRVLGFYETRWFLKISFKHHLESFRSCNLVHFCPERRKSCQTRMRFECIKKKKILRYAQLSGAERLKISI